VHQRVGRERQQRVEVVGGDDARGIQTADLAGVTADLVGIRHAHPDQLERGVPHDLGDHHLADEPRPPHHHALGHSDPPSSPDADRIGRHRSRLSSAN
jgi:hypothetical protein